jgi:hypothetical protein
VVVHKLHTIYTANEVVAMYGNNTSRRHEFIKYKASQRHKVINCYNDFDNEIKELLQKIKHELLQGNEFILSGSRVNGTYLTDIEFELFKDVNQKRSDYDIWSKYKPSKENIIEFGNKYNIKIDFIKNKGITI